MDLRINIPKKVGKGYKTFWEFKGRYRVVKGGRASKKSTTTAMWYIYNMMKYPEANTLVVRRIFNTHKDSTYAELKKAVYYLGVQHLWYFSKSPLEATYLPTGQKILFRGLDNPDSITSITVERGFLCWVWFEEAFQITSEEDFDKIDGSIRGDMPHGYFKQLTLTFNPWSEKHWIKKRFYDVTDPDILALTTNYMCNEFIGADDKARYEAMKTESPRRYQIEGLGEWGISKGLIYENWISQEFNKEDIAKLPGITAVFGLDFGFTADPTAFIGCLLDDKNKELYIFDEFYEKGKVNSEIAAMIQYKGYAKVKIIADAAEPKSIEEIRRAGISNIKAAVKGPDSIKHGIQKIQQYKIIVHPTCDKTITELSHYVWDEKNGQAVNKPIDDYNHLMDALRYAMSDAGKGSGMSVLK